MSVDDEDSNSDRSDWPNPYNARDPYRGEVDLLPTTTHNGAMNKQAHDGNKNPAAIMDYINNGGNHSGGKIVKIQATLVTLVGII